MLKNLTRTLAGIAVLGIAAATSGCDNPDLNINGKTFRGLPLAQLDLDGKEPEDVTLLGPDIVLITKGKRLTITIEGDEAAQAKLRFMLDEKTLGIAREGWSKGDGIATIRITLPALRKVTLAGSGTVTIDEFSGEQARVTIAGSGDVNAPNVAVDKFKVSLAGSGTLLAGGAVRSLKLSMAGTGQALMADLQVTKAKIHLAGSGMARFSSDGDVGAHIVGSGEVHVRGRANCKVETLGSGRLVCEPAETAQV